VLAARADTLIIASVVVERVEVSGVAATSVEALGGLTRRSVSDATLSPPAL